MHAILTESDNQDKFQQLLEATFPEMVVIECVRWKQLQTRASNETAKGKEYIIALQTNVTACQPLQSLKLIQNCTLKWRKDEQSIRGKDLGDEHVEIISVFGPFQQHLTKLLNLIGYAFENDINESTIPWKNKEQSHLFTYTRVMSIEMRKIASVYDLLDINVTLIPPTVRKFKDLKNFL